MISRLRSIWLLPVLLGCGDPDVRLYVALDQEHSEAIIDRFQRETGLTVAARFDTEAQKTVGLVTAIKEERSRPRCDVFWNNELAHTVHLAGAGLLDPYDSPAAAAIPDAYRDSRYRWTGFAARARILIVNKQKIENPAEYPTSMWDLLDPKWRGNCAVAAPLTGTTLTHFTALRQVLGQKEFERFLDGLTENEVMILDSNGATMKATVEGRVAFAFTDTDDFHVALTKGHDVAAVFPDQGTGQLGTMLIPNSVAIVKGGPNPAAARTLVDFILSEDVEALLAAAKSAQIPVRAGVEGPASPEIKGIGQFRAMDWDPEVAAQWLDPMSQSFAKRFGM